jgi:hypothetical protein
MTARTKPKTELEREAEHLIADGYCVIDPGHNAMTTLLAELGKADLSPREVEELCQTAKCAGLNGFTRIDLLPCGCCRTYKGMILGYYQNQNHGTISLGTGGIEGVKPCPKHAALVEGIKL